jgi:hypothetical protein
VFLLLLGLAIVVGLVAVLLGYVVRVMLTVVLIAGAPIALMFHALPQTEGIARWWWRRRPGRAGVGRVGPALHAADAPSGLSKRPRTLAQQVRTDGGRTMRHRSPAGELARSSRSRASRSRRGCWAFGQV